MTKQEIQAIKNAGAKKGVTDAIHSIMWAVKSNCETSTYEWPKNFLKQIESAKEGIAKAEQLFNSL
jgi:hypothetical protein